MKKVSNNYHYYNNHEYKIFITILSVIFLLGCSPSYRYNRLLEKYPYLQDTIQQTEIVVRDSIHQDTQIVWNTKIDTIVLNQVRIERRNDTFRILTRERPCTTYVNKTIVKPSETIKQYIEKKASEKGIPWGVSQNKRMDMANNYWTSSNTFNTKIRWILTTSK